eukprot:4560290-Alexandrium_andersonii.AAC.1
MSASLVGSEMCIRDRSESSTGAFASALVSWSPRRLADPVKGGLLGEDLVPQLFCELLLVAPLEDPC